MNKNSSTIPNVFISYSWEDEEHKLWVRKLAESLLGDGINAIVDQYDLEPGDRIPAFMEKISEVDKVIVICTPTYKEKTDKRVGGVGYESNIITGELFTGVDERKYIPVIRKGEFDISIPNALKGKFSVDLRGTGKSYEENYNDLITTIKGKRRKLKPAIGVNKDEKNKNEFVEKDEIYISGIITDKVTMPSLDGTRGSALYKIPFQLSNTPSSLWKELFISAWNMPPSFTTMHKPSIAQVVGDEIVLNGTTIEEVKKYHRDTLVLCVDIANKKENEILKKEADRKERATIEKKKHEMNVIDIASKIKF